MAAKETTPVEPPRHAFELEIKIGAETWERLLCELGRLDDHVREHGSACNMASGGGGSSSSVHIELRDVTPEQYREELEAWCHGRRSSG